jgi:hypothetical protein
MRAIAPLAVTSCHLDNRTPTRLVGAQMAAVNLAAAIVTIL